MMSALFLATARPIQGGPKTGTLLYAFTRCAITSLNIHRFSNLFHSLNWENICNNKVTKDFATAQVGLSLHYLVKCVLEATIENKTTFATTF